MNLQTKQVSATPTHDCGKSTSDELGQNPNCAHGYDAGCLICGFGTKDGKRVWHNNKPKAEVSIRTKESDFAVGDLVVPKSNTVNSVPAVREVIELDGDDKFLITIGGNHRQSWRFIDGWRTATLAEIATGHRIDEPKTQVVMRADELEITPYCVECDRKTLKVLHTANDAAYSKQRAKLRVEFWKTAFAISGCINLLLIAAAMVGGDL